MKRKKLIRLLDQFANEMKRIDELEECVDAYTVDNNLMRDEIKRMRSESRGVDMTSDAAKASTAGAMRDFHKDVPECVQDALVEAVEAFPSDPEPDEPPVPTHAEVAAIVAGFKDGNPIVLSDSSARALRLYVEHQASGWMTGVK
jgi:hypothetical protein